MVLEGGYIHTHTYLAPLLALWSVVLQCNQSCPHHVQPVDIHNIICSTALIPKYAIRKGEEKEER